MLRHAAYIRWLRLSAICAGVVVDSNHQVLNVDNEPISGLYSIGDVSGPFYGGVDYPLEIAGISLGRCFTEGYVICRKVATL